MSDRPPSEFEKIVPKQSGGNLFSEFWHLLRQNKKWWLIPPLILLVLFGLLMVLSGTAVAPFIYTLF